VCVCVCAGEYCFLKPKMSPRYENSLRNKTRRTTEKVDTISIRSETNGEKVQEARQ